MTIVKTLATHEIVQIAYPRPVTERDQLGTATGKAIDAALSRYSHEFRQDRRPTASAMNRFATSILDEELKDADVALGPEGREKVLGQISGVLRAFRRSEIFGLPRPRTRLILINGRVGVYAQPDYWDGRGRFYEMKSYRAVPPPPDVELQLELFQLAFGGLRAFLACFNRHSTPVGVSVTEVPRLSDERAREVLAVAYQTGLLQGKEKILEYIDSPLVQYSLQP